MQDGSAVNDQLLAFLKALADANRLRIVGLLSRESATVEQLAAQLGLGMSTTSHHLARLAGAGLVSSTTRGHHSVYTLQLDTLTGLAQQFLEPGRLPALAGDAPSPEEAFDRKVLQSFTDGERITAFPAQRKKFLVLLRHVLPVFEVGVRYTEREVNARLARYHEDTARLRRSLVDEGLMRREGGGGAYWRPRDESR